MNAKYEDGKITLDLHELLESVSPETKLEMIESLGCDSDIIKHVTSQILERWTENCLSGSALVTASADPHLGLDWAWREVAKRSTAVAGREIERLEAALKYKDECYLKAMEENREMRLALMR